MVNNQLAPAGSEWREKIGQLQTLLEQVRADLIEAEAELAEQMSAVNAFEFTLRVRLEPLVRKLEAVEAEIDKIMTKRYWPTEEAEEEDHYAYWGEEGAAASGDFRYMGETPPQPPQTLNEDETAVLKTLYRQLARRFHPDMAGEDKERATQMMMAINAAYAAGDLARLRELALEPDPDSLLDHADTDRQLAEALLRELSRHQRRLAEIKQELEDLFLHQSARLMRRAQHAAEAGRDLLAEIEADIRQKIAEKRMERDLLQSEAWDDEQATLQDEEFDEGVLTLEEWMLNQMRPIHLQDDSDDILDDE